MFGTEQILKGYRSISPGERSVQSVRSGKHRAGFTEHRFTHDVQIEYVQLPAMSV